VLVEGYGGAVVGENIPSSCRFITPGADEVVLRFFSSMPAMAESTLLMSDASAAMLCDVMYSQPRHVSESNLF
jgi:hypothetical protein